MKALSKWYSYPGMVKTIRIRRMGCWVVPGAPFSRNGSLSTIDARSRGFRGAMTLRIEAAWLGR